MEGALLIIFVIFVLPFLLVILFSFISLRDIFPKWYPDYYEQFVNNHTDGRRVIDQFPFELSQAELDEISEGTKYKEGESGFWIK